MTSFLLLSLLLVQIPAATPTQTGVVTGTLRTDTGLPLQGVRVAVTPANGPIADTLLTSLGLTDTNGRYRLDNVSPGPYNILVSSQWYHPGVTESGQATRIQVVAGSTLEVPAMMFAGKSVTGRVVDMDTGEGRRLDNLVLCCDYSQLVLYREGGLKQGSPFIATISNDGSFIFPSVTPGNYALSTLDRHVISVSWALAVGTNGVTGLRLEVTEGVDVQGTVLDQTGMPVTASVQLRPKPVDSVVDTMGPPTYSGESQRLQTAAQPMGWGPGVVLRQSLIRKANPSLDDVQDWILEKARTLERSATPGPDGRFMFQSVPPGAYVLEAKSGGVALPGREIQVGLAGLTNVSFQVTAVQVTGRVIAPGGGPLPKLNYIRLVRDGSDSDISYGFPDKEGQFSLALLPGQYRVFTERLGSAVQSVSDGSRDITNTELTVVVGRSPQIVVTLQP